MKSWFSYFKQGFARERQEDPLLKKNGSQEFKRNFKNLTPFLKKYWKQGLTGFILILITTLMAFPNPLIRKAIIDDVIIDKKLQMLAGLAIAYAVIRILAKLLNSFMGFYFSRLEQSILIEIQTKLMDHTLKLPKSFFDKKEIGYLMSRLSSDVMGLRFFFSSTLLNVVISILQFIGGLIFLFYLKWQLAWIILIIVPLVFWTVKLFGKKMFNLSTHNMEQNARVNKTIQESLAVSPLIKAYNSEKQTISKITRQLKKALNLNLETASVSTGANFSINLLPEIFRFFVLIAGAIMIVNGKWTIGALLAFQSYTSFVYGPALYMANVNIRLQGALVSLSRVSGLFDIVPEENLEDGEILKENLDTINFKDVSFTYDKKEMVLSDLNFQLKKGCTYALVGQSGVGKTTLISLLLCFYKASKGEIAFNGTPISHLNLSKLRQRIGYLNQTPYIISGTILENIIYGSKDHDTKKALKAARMAGIETFIQTLPDGNDHLLTEGGVNLSQGQKQRIALARVIYKNPDLIILDEPTSALDETTMELIMKNLSGFFKNKIFIIITHNRETIKQTEKALVLKNDGTFEIRDSLKIAADTSYLKSLTQTSND